MKYRIIISSESCPLEQSYIYEGISEYGLKAHLYGLAAIFELTGSEIEFDFVENVYSMMLLKTQGGDEIKFKAEKI